MMNQIYRQIQDYDQAKLSTIVTNTQYMMRVKLNTDGTRDKRGNAGCGEWLQGFIKHIGVCDTYISAEL